MASQQRKAKLDELEFLAGALVDHWENKAVGYPADDAGWRALREAFLRAFAEADNRKAIPASAVTFVEHDSDDAPYFYLRLFGQRVGYITTPDEIECGAETPESMWVFGPEDLMRALIGAGNWEIIEEHLLPGPDNVKAGWKLAAFAWSAQQIAASKRAGAQRVLEKIRELAENLR